MKNQLQIFMMLGIFLLPLGCVTTPDSPSSESGGDTSGARLVERYKDAPPPWIQMEAGKLHSDRSQFQYIEIRSRLPDLPIGVKESQLSALEASEKELRELGRGDYQAGKWMRESGCYRQ